MASCEDGKIAMLGKSNRSNGMGGVILGVSSGASVLCSRLRIRETTEEPTPMQTHEDLLASSSLGPSVPDTAEQGLGPRSGLQLGFL